MMEIEEVKPRSILKLDDNLEKALEMVGNIKKLEAKLPSVDCGACGAPTCGALAEDIIRNQAKIENCIFVEKDSGKFYDIINEIWGNDKIIKL
jgi:Na+-translocating ferredoxin:NAD+ oxidoreductase RNF subunit RnfB